METTAVIWIGTGKTTAKSQIVADVRVAEQGVGRARNGTTLAKWLVWQHPKEACSANSIDGGYDGIETHARWTGVFSNSKVGSTFVKTKTKMQFPVVIEGRVQKAERAVHESRGLAAEDEIGFCMKATG
jgi:hypothetical protein